VGECPISSSLVECLAVVGGRRIKPGATAVSVRGFRSAVLKTKSDSIGGRDIAGFIGEFDVRNKMRTEFRKEKPMVVANGVGLNQSVFGHILQFKRSKTEKLSSSGGYFAQTLKMLREVLRLC